MAPPAIRRAGVRAWVARRLAAAPSTPVGYVGIPHSCLLATYLREEHGARAPHVSRFDYTADGIAAAPLAPWGRWVVANFDQVGERGALVLPGRALALLDDLPPDPDEGPEGDGADDAGESDGGAAATVPEPERELAGVA